jgi:hypothetical protein
MTMTVAEAKDYLSATAKRIPTPEESLPEGMVIRVRQQNEVLIDWDSPAGLPEEKLMFVIWRAFGEYTTVSTKSRNGNRHIVITFKHPVSDIEAIAIQAILGSDPMREALALIQLKLGATPTPIVFFEAKS